MVPFDGPNLGAVFISWNRNWFRRADPESPPSKSAFYLSSAAGVRRACVDAPVKIYTCLLARWRLHCCSCPPCFIMARHLQLQRYPYQCTLRLWYLETPMTLVQRTGTAPLIDCIRQVLGLWPYSTSALISLFALLVNLMNVFAIHWKSLESPSFHPFRWLKGSARDLHGTQAAHSKKILREAQQVPGGALFSQLKKGVKDAMVISTEWCDHQNMQKGYKSSKKTIRKIQWGEVIMHKGYKKIALVKSQRKVPMPSGKLRVDECEDRGTMVFKSLRQKFWVLFDSLFLNGWFLLFVVFGWVWLVVFRLLFHFEAWRYFLHNFLRKMLQQTKRQRPTPRAGFIGTRSRIKKPSVPMTKTHVVLTCFVSVLQLYFFVLVCFICVCLCLSFCAFLSGCFFCLLIFLAFLCVWVFVFCVRFFVWLCSCLFVFVFWLFGIFVCLLCFCFCGCVFLRQ